MIIIFTSDAKNTKILPALNLFEKAGEALNSLGLSLDYKVVVSFCEFNVSNVALAIILLAAFLHSAVHRSPRRAVDNIYLKCHEVNLN